MNFKKLFPVLPEAAKQEALQKHAEVLSTDPADIPETSYGLMRKLVGEIFTTRKAQKCIKFPPTLQRVSDKASFFNTANETFRRARGLKSCPFPAREPIPILPFADQIKTEINRNFEINAFALPSCNEDYDLDGDDQPVKAVAVPDKGKMRIITKEFGESKCLNHVQKILHKVLCSQDEIFVIDRPVNKQDMQYLLEDPDAPPNSLWISGDYESATDFLSLDLVTELLWEIQKYLKLPLALLNSFLLTGMPRKVLYPDGSSIIQKRGQLMGNIISFPLLCIINYTAFRSVFPRRRVKINGDDIAFRATRDEFNLWKKAVEEFSLVLNDRKTIVDDKMVNLNSQSFFQIRNHVENIQRLPYGSVATETCIESLKGLSDSILFKSKTFLKFKKTDNRPLFGLTIHGGMGILPQGRLHKRNMYYLKVANMSMKRSYENSRLQKRLDPVRPDNRALLSYQRFVTFEDKEVKRYNLLRRKNRPTVGATRHHQLVARAW